MSNVAILPILADRYQPLVRTIDIVGIDLTGATMRAQIRAGGDIPGAPLADLTNTNTAGSQGLRLVDVTFAVGLATSRIEMVISEATMEGLPFSGAIGEVTTLAWDFELTVGARKRRIAKGAFQILGDGVTGAEVAPTRRTLSGMPSTAPAGMIESARLTFGDEVVTIELEQADLFAPIVEQVRQAGEKALQQAGSVSEMIATSGLSNSTIMTEALTVSSLKDSDGKVLAGDLRDGRRVASAFVGRPRLDVRRVGLFEHIFVTDHLGSTQLTHRGNHWAPEWLLGGMIRYSTDANGYVETYVMKPDGSGKTRVSPVVWEHWQGVGQSLMLGANNSATGSGAGVTLTPANVTPQAFMFSITGGSASYGPRPHIDSAPANVNDPLLASKITGIEPLHEATQGVYGETCFSGFAAQYLRGAPVERRILCEAHARGAAPWIEPYNSAGTFIAPGSPHFATGQALQLLGKRYVEAAGGSYMVGGWIDMHGEADAARGNTAADSPPTSFADYLQYQKDKIEAYARHCHTDSNFHRRRRMYTKQISSMVVVQPGAFDIARAQVQAALDDRRFVIPAPGYRYVHGDGIHLVAAGQRAIGEQIGKWARRVENEGFDHRPFICFEAKRIGAIVYCRFYVPVPPIQIRTDLGITALANAGITYEDDSASGVTITNVAVSDAAKGILAVTLSSAAVGSNPRLCFGKTPTTNGWSGPDKGARTNICDSDDEVGALTGDTLTNWALHWQQGII